MSSLTFVAEAVDLEWSESWSSSSSSSTSSSQKAGHKPKVMYSSTSKSAHDSPLTHESKKKDVNKLGPRNDNFMVN